MDQLTEGEKHSGLFAVDGKDRSGTLILAGRNTNLYLHDPEDFRPDRMKDRCIQGVIHDRTRVSLHDCVGSSISGSATRNGEHYAFANLFPHFVLHGARHLGPTERAVRSVSFTVDDAPIIFHDFDAFGHVLRPRRHIRALTRSQGSLIDRQIAVGDRPEIAYFSGRTEIMAAQTVLGRVSADHWLRRNWGRSDGISIDSTITLTIDFPERLAFPKVIEAVSTLLLFLQIVAGRRQNLGRLTVHIGTQLRPESLNVYWSQPPRRDVEHKGREPFLRDLPLLAAKEPEVFARVLSAWLERHDAWRDARLRFANSFAQENSYDVDRLIGSANMFDLLPAGATPSAVLLSAEAEAAQADARKLFKALPDSPQRNGVLGALGRMGQASLREKINHRAGPVLKRLGPAFGGMTDVLALAVDCRNHYVHGSDPKAGYSKNFFATVPFLTNALEFVFVASDLLDAGWDLGAFSRQGSTGSHPVGNFLIQYPEYLRALNQVLPEKTRIDTP